MGKTNKYYTCAFCSKGPFPNSTKLRNHQRKEHANRWIQCSECNEKFLKSVFLTHQKKKHPNSQPGYEVAPPTPGPEALGSSIPEDGGQNADPMDHDDPDLPGPGPATLQMRMRNLPREDPLEKENQNLPGPGPATLEMRKLQSLQMAAQIEEEEMELDDEEAAHGAEDVEEVTCCSRELRARYNVPNKLCAEESKCQNEARISPNDEFMGLIKPSSNGRDYCMQCFAVNPRIQRSSI
ncbi:hypothetical protein L5515_015863 [Caenorhabditis briggsae]|uniref:C2H2-type domain-containing protein n=1 Tax=Caenorhabditis briggsae TaxID=6238 RepID=A0AAE9EJY4_CAEBR|nr:hypothetical protein L5515_015863 [Caenorhabditis briggsae]